MSRAFAAAASSSSHASASSIATAAQNVAQNPSSPFSQLLRSSRFATFDPNIRKTYTAPKQFAQRGYWGLKRPITQRKKNSFITVKQFEARQHYVEWDNAEDQVRFVRRMEELDVVAGGRGESAWSLKIGDTRRNWAIDSEFSPVPVEHWAPSLGDESSASATEDGNSGDAITALSGVIAPNVDGAFGLDSVIEGALSEPAQVPADASAVEVSAETEGETTAETAADLDSPSASDLADNAQTEASPTAQQEPSRNPDNRVYIEHLGNKGPSKYGPKASRPPSYLVPNIHAMTPQEFARYLVQLRAKRPAFKEYLQTVEARAGQPLGNGQRRAFDVAQANVGEYHQRFISQQTAKEYQTTNKIEPRPHRNGGLMYSHPSVVHSFFLSKPKPGFVMHDVNTVGRFQLKDGHSVAAFAGVAARIKPGATNGRVALMQDGQPNRDLWLKSVTLMRPQTTDALMVEKVPTVVGTDISNGLEDTQVRLHVTAHPGYDSPRRINPYFPGTRPYVAQDELKTKQEHALTKEPASGGASGREAAHMARRQDSPLRIPSAQHLLTQSPRGGAALDLAGSAATIDSLQKLLATKLNVPPVSDDSL
ncbi:unnamed protein product [Mycena citricolor]|uniref:Uncharacterized protein n=1 Tax=Mycena citricolor TaxID=2018698 RepID=A0AAD2GZY3_9AGAR|nr:unnamed protein product [Mycena citricolor]